MISKIGKVKCTKCKQVWIAACEHPDTTKVECPNCGFMVTVSNIVKSAPQINKDANATSSNSENL